MFSRVLSGASAAASAAVLACAPSPAMHDAQRSAIAEERLESVVHATAIDTFVATHRGPPLLLADSALAIGHDSRRPSRADSAMWAALVAASRSPGALGQLPTRRPVQRVQDAAAVIRDRGAGATVLWISRVGFSPGREAALVVLNYHCGRRCGGSLTQQFEFRNGRWGLVATLQSLLHEVP